MVFLLADWLDKKRKKTIQLIYIPFRFIRQIKY